MWNNPFVHTFTVGQLPEQQAPGRSELRCRWPQRKASDKFLSFGERILKDRVGMSQEGHTGDEAKKGPNLLCYRREIER